MPTWRGWLLLLIALGLATYGGVRGIHPFLSTHQPVVARVLVIEGWVPDYALEQGLDFYVKQNCQHLLLTDGMGDVEAGLGNADALIAQDRLQRIAGKPSAIHAIQVPESSRHRTYRSAEEVRDWLAEQGVGVRSINVLTLGPHARRSRLLFVKAFGPEIEVGVISVPNRGYDPAAWWRYSEGFKEVVSEAVAYLYVRLLFRPDHPSDL